GGDHEVVLGTPDRDEHGTQRTRLGPKRHARLRRGRFDAEDDHESCSRCPAQGCVTASIRSHRDAQDGPFPDTNTNRPSSSTRVHSSTSRNSSGRSPSIASPHSTNVTPSGSRSSSAPRSMTSWIRSSRYTSTW